MIYRLQKLVTIVGISLVLTVASGCSSGGSGGANPAGGVQTSVDGNWQGRVFSNLFPDGSVSVTLVQNGFSLSGTWFTLDDLGFASSGTLVGTLFDDVVLMTLTASDGCITMVTAVVSGDTISGSYSTDCTGDTGTFTITRSGGGTTLSIDGNWDGTVNSDFFADEFVSFTFFQDDSTLSGTFIAFDEFGNFIGSGTLVGVLFEDALLMTLTASDGCITMVTALVSDDTIFGSYSACFDTGTIALIRS